MIVRFMEDDQHVSFGFKDVIEMHVRPDFTVIKRKQSDDIFCNVIFSDEFTRIFIGGLEHDSIRKEDIK